MTDGTFSEELDLLYPDEVQTMDDVEEMPEPEILPTSETVLNEGEPLPETEASPNAAPPAFDWDSLAVPQLNNYVPRETMPETNNEGSVFMAYLRNENTIGSFLSRGNSRDVANVDLEKFNFVEHLRPDQLDDMEHYALDTSQEEINETEARLSRERRDKAIMESRPWETLGVGLITSPLEPLNYLPGGSIYKQAKTVAGIAKAFAASSFAAVASTTAQEAILHNNQLTRTVQESVWNVATSGLLGGALGTASNLLGKHYRIDAAKEKVAYTQIMDVLIDPDAPQAQVGGSVGATRTQIMGEALANLPEPIKKTMILSPGARLASSDFKIANRFHNEFIEHSFITEANERGQTGGQAVETLIKKRVLEAAGNNVDYFNAYYEMLGIKSGPFKQVRGAIANIGEPEMSSKEFAQRVSRSLFTAVEDPNPYVQKGTKAIQKTFDDIHKTLVELNLLPEGEGTKTSIGYLTIIPNKQLILEQGGRNARGAGTYPQAVFDGIKRSQVAAKEYMQSDFYKEKQTEISRIEDEIRGHPEKLERGLIEDEARQVNGQIKDLKIKIKEASTAKTDELNKLINEEKDSSKQHAELMKSVSKERGNQKKILNSLHQEILDEIHSIETVHIPDFQIYLEKNTLLRDRALREIKKFPEEGKKRDKYSKMISDYRHYIEKYKNAIKQEKDKLEKLHKKDKAFKKEMLRIFKDDESFLFHMEQQNYTGFDKSIITKIRSIEDNHINLSKKIKEAKANIKKNSDLKPLKDELSKLEKQYKFLKESKVKNKTNEQIKKLEDSIEQIKAEIREKAPRLSLDEDGNLWPELDDPTNWGIAMQHVDKVLSMQGDDLLNPVLNRFRNPKPLKGRTLMIDQEALHPWHIQDPVRLATMYSRALAPVVELETKARQYGYNSFEELKTAYSNELKLEYDEKSAGKTGKEAAKLEKQLRSIQKDITASLEMIQGVYSLGGNTVTSTKWEKFLQGVKLYNAYRMLGGITLSSLPDIGVVALRNGVFNTMYHGLLPMLKTAKTVSKRDLRAINYGIQSELGMRIHQFMDQEPLSTNPGFLTKSWEVLGQSFGDLTLFNQWSSMAERLAGTVSIHKTLDTIHAIVNGKTVAKKDRTRLAQLGIKEEYFKYIAEQTSSPDNLSSNGTRVADWTNWQIRDKFEADALRDFQAATAKDIDQTILEPGAGDLPLAARNIYGSLLLQFKSFMFTFTNKVIYSGIQRRKDAETYTGIALMLALGSLSYVSTKYARGEEPELDLKTLAIESIDRSGVLGPLMEVFDIAQTMNALPKSVFGEGVTRYKSRGIMGALTGPTGGTISDVTAVLGKMLQASYGDDDLSTSDIKKMMRLFPLQNISYINWLNDTMVTKIGEKFNLVEDREGK